MTFRSKLIAIVAIDAVALLVLVLASSLTEARVEHQLQSIQQHYLPRIALRPQLESTFERLSRSLQDAVAASDSELLAEARHREEALLALIGRAGDAIPSADAAPLRIALEDYYATATSVSRRLIAGETGEDIVEAIETMQSKQAHVGQLLEQATYFDESGLAKAFDDVTAAQRTGARLRFVISALCVISIIGLSIWMGRSLFTSLAELAAGFRRFGEGDFAEAIPVRSRDELGDVAQQANLMASRLQRQERERERGDWLKAGQAGLVEHLHGEMEPEEAASRAVTFLARHLDVPAAAIYYVDRDGDGELALLASYGLDVGAAPPPRFRIGQGVIGQAALHTEPTVIETPADDALRLRTGLVEVRARGLVLVPLLHAGKITGVLELVLLTAWSEQAGELVRAARGSVTIAIEVAHAQAATRRLLAQTQRQAAELLEARTGLEQKAEELSRASAYKSQFLASMSHELRTPLNAIIGFSELMCDGVIAPDEPQYQEFLHHILASGRHLLELINDVLDLSKVEAGKLELHAEPIELPVVVDEVLGILRGVASSRGVDVVADLAPEVSSLVLDPARLKQVLYNYLSNAIKFTPSGGQVQLRATAEGADQVRFEVEDTGVGISPEDLGRLFADFQQLSDGARKAGGTGLGLALTRRLVEAQGGTVGVRSVVGKGSVFHAILPRISGPVISAPRLTRTGSVVSGVDAPSVLVIEDDPIDQAALAEALSSAGYTVDVVSTGRDGLARARSRRFDAITLDLLLPDMSGLSVLRQLRADGSSRDAPIIVVTVVAERGAVAGFAVHDVLAKPIDADGLAASLRRAGVSPTPNGDVLVVDDDPSALKLMSTTLGQLGYHTRCELDPRVALDGCRGAPPSAIVLDLVMPGMTGFEFLDQLRRDPSARDVPVIVWTSKDLSADEHALLRASADAVVAKGHGGSTAVIAELASSLASRRAG